MKCPQNASDIISRCQEDLEKLTQGYPWYFVPTNTSKRHSFKERARSTGEPGDPLDALNHVCDVLEKTETCLWENNVDPACLIVGNFLARKQSNFQFLCHHQKRDTNLLNSLQCLLDTRVTTMLDFYILTECWNGEKILNDQMSRKKNALYYNLNVWPSEYVPRLVSSFCCFPTDALVPCVKPIITTRCGDEAATMVVDYIIFVQDQYKENLIRAGLNPDPCMIDRSRYVNDALKPDFRNYSTSSETESRQIASKEEFNRLLVEEAPGTFLDTEFGRSLLTYIISLTREELCEPIDPFLAYATCGFIADDVTADTRFNILQFAHQLLPVWYHGTRCSKLDVFRTCWEGLQNICGQVTRGFRLHATLLAKSCALDDIMDIKQCKWQDMLLRPYLESSRKTIWPIHFQLPDDFFLLEPAIYHGPSLGNELMDAIHMLQPGVDEIAARCDKDAADNLTSLYSDIGYDTYDTIKYLEWWSHNMHQAQVKFAKFYISALI